MTELAKRLRLYLLDGNFLRAAELDDFELEATLRHNEVGDWRLTTSFNAGAPWLRFAGRGSGILLTRDGVPILVGLLDERTITETAGDGGYVIELEAIGSDALVLLADRWADPIGGTGGPDYSGQAYDLQDGPAETVMRYFVNVNTGQLARPDRRINALFLAAGDSGSGGTARARARFDNLLSLLQQIALIADPQDTGLRFAIRMHETIAGRLEFVVSTPRDLRATIKFDTRLGSASKATLREAAPTVNTVVAGAEGVGQDQALTEYVDGSIARYGRRIERFVNVGPDASAADVAAQSAEALASGGEAREFEIEAVDGAPYTWGAQDANGYDLGDRVTCVVAGLEGDGVVREIGLRIAGDGIVVTPRISTTATSFQPPQERRLAAVEDRLAFLERINQFGSIGMIILWSRPLGEIPVGWAHCDGSTLSSGYVVQDLRGRVPVGVDGAHALGAVGGSLTANVAHTHIVAAADLAHAHTILASALAHTHTILASALAHAHDILASALAHAHSILAADLAHTHPGSHSHPPGLHQHNTDIDHDHPSFLTGPEAPFANLGGFAPTTVVNTSYRYSIDVPALGFTSRTSGAPSAVNTGTDSTAPAASFTGGLATQSGQPASNPSTQSGQPSSNPSTQSGQPSSNPSTQSGQPASDVTTGSAGSTTSIEQPWRGVYFIERVPAAA